MRLFPALTLIELLLVIGIIGIIAGTTILNVRGVRDDSAMIGSVELLVANLNKAHNYAREEKDATSWSIEYIDDNNYRFSKYVSAANWETVASYTLQKGIKFKQNFPRIIFSQSSGFLNNPTTPITIELQNESNTLNKTININKSGVVSVN